MKLIIQIPCYNEESTLAQTIGDLPTAIAGIDVIEYLVINDGSTDRTVEVAREAGVHHVVSFIGNKGLARGFTAGIDACLKLGADIIVNTDADNQYCGADVEKLVRPILDKTAEIVVGERPIDETEHFSPMKKRLQRIGSLVVRMASNTSIPDAPSGFRAYSREAALHINVINNYTYTLETIIQAGANQTAITSVPIATNPELRKSRLFKSTSVYIKKSASTIVRSLLMYRPLEAFVTVGIIFFVAGILIDLRFLILMLLGDTRTHMPSLILAATFIILGIQTAIIGFLGDIIAANRKIVEDIQYRIRKLEAEKPNDDVKMGAKDDFERLH